MARRNAILIVSNWKSTIAIGSNGLPVSFRGQETGSFSRRLQVKYSLLPFSWTNCASHIWEERLKDTAMSSRQLMSNHYLLGTSFPAFVVPCCELPSPTAKCQYWARHPCHQFVWGVPPTKREKDRTDAGSFRESLCVSCWVQVVTEESHLQRLHTDTSKRQHEGGWGHQPKKGLNGTGKLMVSPGRFGAISTGTVFWQIYGTC